MAKIAEKYLKVDPWLVIEEGFHAERGRVSESLFSLANEYMGVRGYFDEGYSGDKLLGSYINGLYEEKEIHHPAYFKGFATRFCFMVNTLDWLYTRIKIDGEMLDMAESRISDFVRVLDMKNGTLSREYLWETNSGKKLRIKFLRFLSMASPNLGCQRVIIEPLNFSGSADMVCGLDFSPIHEQEGRNFWTCTKKGQHGDYVYIQGITQKSRQQLFSAFRLETSAPVDKHFVAGEKFAGLSFKAELKEGSAFSFDKMVINHDVRNKEIDVHTVWSEGTSLSEKHDKLAFDEALDSHKSYWADVWNKLDITIEGDPENQQGVRFCIFNLHQTYHGADPTLNVGAKGLTGEQYWGWTWWDTETYCLPFYMFNNPRAAESLLEYRYNTLPQALDRAVEMDCKGACYPMGTIDGTESCFVWQHGNLEVHVTAAIPYGIWHYMRVCGDKTFLYQKGIEVLLQCSRYFASRGNFSQRTGEFGIYGVMGADEFHMMVNNNTYTNIMAKKTFEYTLEVIEEMMAKAPGRLEEVFNRVDLKDGELEDWRLKAEKMRISFDEASLLFEQHDGYFDLPHTDVKAIPHTEFPVYKNWAYDRIFRTDMIKQPDVLLFLFFFSGEYCLDIKKANYDYYEPRCSHESSLSPAIHSILASELGMHDEALGFSKYSSRIDLDDYNRNTHEGLHITSMAATWMNIVYGFGGMRSDGETLIFNPTLPKGWDSYSFRILYKGSVLSITINRDKINLVIVNGPSVVIKVYGKSYSINTDCVSINIPEGCIG